MQQRYLILQSTIRTGSGCLRIASSIITSREVKVTGEVINAMEENLLLRSKKDCTKFGEKLFKRNI